MLVYLYDGSLEGLFSLFSQLLQRQETAEKIAEEARYQPGLFEEHLVWETELERYQKLKRYLFKKGGSENFWDLLYAFCSEAEGRELVMWEYLQKILRDGFSIRSNWGVDPMRRMLMWRREVGREAHLYKGLLRFRQLKNGVFYAPIEPKVNIFPFLIPHFRNRLPQEQWVIHDVTRAAAVAYANGQIQTLWNADGRLDRQISEAFCSEEEQAFQVWWRQFCQTVAIAGRRNKKLQQQNMPKRFWRFLTERTVVEQK